MPLVVALQMFTGHTEISIGPSNKQKCPLDIQMSIRLLDKQKCPVDIEMSIRPMDRWTNGHCLMENTSASYRQGVMLNHIMSLCFIALLSDAVKVTCPFGIIKCPLDIQKCLFVHRTNRNVHTTFKCPFVH